MPNDSSAWPDKSTMREGGEMSATQLGRVIDGLSRRIVGDNKNVSVRSFPGNQLVIESIGTKKSATKTESKAPKIWWGPYIDETYFPDPDPNNGSTIPQQAMIRQENGEMWIVNSTRTGWTCINRLKRVPE